MHLPVDSGIDKFVTEILSSVESQKDINAIKRCYMYVENQKGAITVQSLWLQHPSGFQWNTIELHLNAFLILNQQYMTGHVINNAPRSTPGYCRTLGYRVVRCHLCRLKVKLCLTDKFGMSLKESILLKILVIFLVVSASRKLYNARNLCT